VDIVVSADLRTLTRVWMGDVRLAETVRAGLIRLDGPPPLVRAFPTWLTLRGFAGVERVAAAVAARPASRPGPRCRRALVDFSRHERLPASCRAQSDHCDRRHRRLCVSPGCPDRAKPSRGLRGRVRGGDGARGRGRRPRKVSTMASLDRARNFE